MTSAEKLPVPLIDPPFAACIELEAIVLDGCSVTRGDFGTLEQGKAQTRFDVEYALDQGDGPLFLVKSDTRLTNQEDELVAEIHVAFAAVYAATGDFGEPSESDIYAYTNGRLMLHVMPFIREFLSTITNRMGIPPFLMPVFRTGAREVHPRPMREEASVTADV